jgi:hypothetical protein
MSSSGEREASGGDKSGLKLGNISAVDNFTVNHSGKAVNATTVISGSHRI